MSENINVKQVNFIKQSEIGKRQCASIWFEIEVMSGDLKSTFDAQYHFCENPDLARIRLFSSLSSKVFRMSNFEQGHVDLVKRVNDEFDEYEFETD